jgi:tRNA threonylcarbamoyladenosine biosynthesis protein TsaB
MIVLGLDTSTMTASVAVTRAGAVLASADVATTAHSDVLLQTIVATVRAAGLAPTALDAVAVGAGPGSFTGLRIGMATAKGIAFAVGRPLYAISSLAALAFDASVVAPGALITAVLDARRGEVYAGFYRRAGAGVDSVAPERVMAPAELAAAITALRGATDAIVVGDAIAIHALAFDPPIVARPDLRTTASGAAVARLASVGEQRDALTDGAPVYIRPAEAELKYPDGVPGALRRR